MCYSCHDGYVDDSRARTRVGYQHPMAAVAKLHRQQRPEHVPLLNEETVYCGTCHTPHGPGEPAAQGLQLEGNSFLRLAAQTGEIELCIECHEYAPRPNAEVGNHPLSETKFPMPVELEQHYAILAPNGGMSCQTCHNIHGAVNRLMVIRGGDDGTSIGLCRTCHASDYSEVGLGRFSHPTTVPLTLEGGEMPRFPNGEPVRLNEQGNMTCFSCHDVHESAGMHSVLRASANDDAFCATCHGDYVKGIGGTGHDLNIRAPEATNLLGETVAEAGTCSACHVVHKARNAYLWARPTRGGRHVIDRLCLSCHSPGGLAETVIRAPTVHPTEIDKRLIRQRAEQTGQPQQEEPSLAIPIYDVNGQEAERGSITCATCHDAHSWSPPGTATDEPFPPTGHGTALNSFLRARSEDQLCKHCHGAASLWRYKYWHEPQRWRK